MGTLEAGLKKLISGADLSQEEMTGAMGEMMSGEASEILTAGFLTALQAKGPTTEEICSAALYLRSCGTRISMDGERLVDTCGTGGDDGGTFNVSTGAAFLVASAGGKVVKHGNRSVTSRCGSADVLESLGARIDLTPEESRELLEKEDMAFLFAPLYHPAMKHVAPVRKALGIRTIFNLLGPLLNPASANCQVVGVYNPQLTRTFAFVLRYLGSRHILAVHGVKDRLDEIALSGPTNVTELREGSIKEYRITPEQLGVESAPLSSLRGGDNTENAGILQSIFAGEKGPRRDFLVINGAASLYVAGLAENLTEGVKLAETLIDNGKALAKMKSYCRTTQEITGKRR